MKTKFKSSALAMCLSAGVILTQNVYAINASPHSYTVTQPDGTKITLFQRGNEHQNWEEDVNGYTVIKEKVDTPKKFVSEQDLSKKASPVFTRYVYAEQSTTGELKPTSLEVGKGNPEHWGLKKHAKPRKTNKYLKHQSYFQSSLINPALKSMKNSNNVGSLNNLVVLIRFADHANRKLPSRSNFEILFNKVGGDPSLAPAGSIKDIYLRNSYNKLTLNSTIVDWITVSKTEAASKNNLHVTLKEALTKADATLDFSQFDKNNDGIIDALTFIHSGYGAEWGGNDCNTGAPGDERIWSHQGGVSGWTSKEGVSSNIYSINPGLWGKCGDDITRIGVIAHELGHVFGLPDLYDKNGGGGGIGSFGMMCNSWGADGSQQPPPFLSAWSKMKLGWGEHSNLSRAGDYNINNQRIYRVNKGFDQGEYLLIENRRRNNASGKLVDNMPPNSDGLAIWHIDESASTNTEGHPDQDNWPRNGQHYKVAMLQADGLYQIEKGQNSGDSNDTYRAGNVTRIGPDTVPNTDTYQNGYVNQTNNVIYNISRARENMSFSYSPDGDFHIPDEGPEGYTKCTDEGGFCVFNRSVDVAYGAKGKFNFKYGINGTVHFNNTNFGDPIPGVFKAGYYKNASTSSTKSYQAEDNSRAVDAKVSTSVGGYTGSGFMDYGKKRSFVEWNDVSATKDGQVLLTFRYANGSSTPRRCVIKVNGRRIGHLSFDGTGSWTNWRTQTIRVQLKQGNNTIQLKANTDYGGPNLDKMDVK
ncbi:M6 family metalloprotease domain-containing protein [Pleionea sediminis]|uniref:M6 family metalloprotease domain-containing protein n=1 Tax=Pleionea sediminis TaxID=2569479 RepID=UPI0011858BB8|nr:M6 family metalloprotease domain-containing protein [Pleionea sediminis]